MVLRKGHLINTISPRTHRAEVQRRREKQPCISLFISSNLGRYVVLQNNCVKKRLEMGLKIAYNRDSFGGDIMKLLSVRDLKTKSSQVWKDLPDQKEMVITSNGRPIAILSSVNENNLEQVLSAFRQARAIEAVTSIQYESVRKGKDKITLEEINNEIKTVRSKRAL
jgi:antitoxin (DNA-binding transcriptional repressor) of toxin-antitoxin stability system